MQIFAALCMLSALGYLLWRVQSTVAWIERVPFVLDVAMAVGIAAAGSSGIAGSPLITSLGAGVIAGSGMAIALVAAYGIAVLCGRLPGMSGVEMKLELPASSSAEALRWLHHRLRQHGFEQITETPEGGLVARQGMNKMQWDRHIRPKRLTASITPGDAGSVAAIELRYMPPAMGVDRYLRPIAEALREEPKEVHGDRAPPRLSPPLELIVVFAFLVLFAMITFAPR